MTILLTCLLAAALAAPEPLEIDRLLAGVAKYEFGDSRESQARLSEYVRSSLASPPSLRRIETRMLRFLESDASAAGKDFVFRELSLIATKASVPVLTRLLARPETAEMARYALARISGAAMGGAPKGKAAVPEPAATGVLVKAFPKLPALEQVRALAVLEERGDISAKPLVLAATRGGPKEVQAAAFEALGRLGDESDVMFLAEAAASGQAAARGSLCVLRGARVEAAIVAAIGSTSGKVKAELIAAAGERGSAAAAGVLAGALEDQDPAIAREALRGLRNVAGPAQVPALLGLVLKSPAAAQRREAAQTLASTLKRSRPAPMGEVLAAYQTAPAREARLSLLDCLGQTSNEEALSLLRDSLKSPDAEIARAAILALSGWDHPAPLADLLAAAESGANPALRILALRGYLKLVALPALRPAPESARLLAQAMRLATQPAEKRTVLSLLAAFPCSESLDLARTFMADDAVAKEAQSAVSQIHSILDPGTPKP
ncbi:MAG: HEAT repeat domain-containing protein [Acidobacteria bacterium]|nr:HEAT repeat domain-containing protein [Acidobacteriota bacterium]